MLAGSLFPLGEEARNLPGGCSFLPLPGGSLAPPSPPPPRPTAPVRLRPPAGPTAARVLRPCLRVPSSDFFGKYKMHDKIGALGGLYVKGRDGCDDGWYLGAGTADAEANFSKMPGSTTPQKKKRRRVGKPPAAARNLRSRVAGSN